jgi:branched-chain amino acid transport system substrate-binding protein
MPGAVAVLALLGTVILVAGFTTKKAASTYKVAWVGPVTGPFAAASTGSLNTAAQFVPIQNKKGGVDGHQLEFIQKDDGGDPTQTLQIVRDLSGQGVKIFFIQTAAGMTALQPLMNGSIIAFYTLPPAPLNDPKTYPYGFNFFPPNKFALLKDAQYLKKLGGITKVALVTNTTAQFQEYLDAAHDVLPKQGFQIVLEQRYDPSTTDFSPVITKIQQSGAQATLVFSLGGEATKFYTAAAAANVQMPLLGGYGNAASDLSSVPQDYLKKWGYFVTTTPALLDPKTNQPATPKYAAILRQIFYHKYGLKPNIGGGLSWDYWNSLVWALHKAGSDDPTKLRQAYESTARASAGVAFTPGGVVYHFSNTQHGGYPPAQVAVAHLYGVPQWPGFYAAAT